MTVQVAANIAFAEGPESAAFGPMEAGDSGSASANRSLWRYRQMISAWRFGTVNDCPNSPALPSPDANPYRGLTASGGQLGEIDLSLRYVDAFGNQTWLDPSVPTSLSLPYGYTDPIIGLASWPAAAASYVFNPGSEGTVELTISLSLQFDKFTASGSVTSAQATAIAAKDAARYRDIFYQFQQPDLAVSLETSLGSCAADQDQLKAALGAFVTKAKLFTDAAASQQAQTYVIAEGDTLQSIAAAWNVSAGDLAQANSMIVVDAMFKGPVVRPIYVAAGIDDSLETLVLGKTQSTFPPVCGAGGHASPIRRRLDFAGVAQRAQRRWQGCAHAL